MTRARSPRLPRHRMAPGQMTLDGAMLRAQQLYPEAVRFRPTRNGTVLALIPGGAPLPAAPVVAVRKVA